MTQHESADGLPVAVEVGRAAEFLTARDPNGLVWTARDVQNRFGHHLRPERSPISGHLVPCDRFGRPFPRHQGKPIPGFPTQWQVGWVTRGSLLAYVKLLAEPDPTT